MVISNIQTFCLVFLATQCTVAMRCLLLLPGRDHNRRLGLHKAGHVLSRCKAAVRSTGRTAAFPNTERKQQICGAWPQQYFWALHMVRKETPRRLQGSQRTRGTGSGSASSSASSACEDIQMWKQPQQAGQPQPPSSTTSHFTGS